MFNLSLVMRKQLYITEREKFCQIVGPGSSTGTVNDKSFKNTPEDSTTKPRNLDWTLEKKLKSIARIIP